MARRRIALVTTSPRPDVSHDRDMPLLLKAVEDAGAEGVAVAWDDPGADWAAFDLVVIRSTWDYTWRTGEFLAWADRCGAATRLANPPSVVRWNTDKHYLGDLAAAGVPVVDTRFLEPGEPVVLPGAAGDGGEHAEYVVKPTAGAGARLAARYTPEERDAALRHVAHLHAEGLTAMVQPYMRRIDTAGERALLFLRGRLVHATRKNAVLSPGTAYDARKVPHPGVRTWTPTDAELAVARQALAAVPVPDEPLYARVDLVEDEDGGPRVMELELVEPNFFLDLNPGSVPVVAAALVEYAAGR